MRQECEERKLKTRSGVRGGNKWRIGELNLVQPVTLPQQGVSKVLMVVAYHQWCLNLK